MTFERAMKRKNQSLFGFCAVTVLIFVLFLYFYCDIVKIIAKSSNLFFEKLIKSDSNLNKFDLDFPKSLRNPYLFSFLFIEMRNYVYLLVFKKLCHRVTHFK